MSFRKDFHPLFVGPFETSEGFKDWWAAVKDCNPSFSWRPWCHDASSLRDAWVALGYAEREHRGILSWVWFSPCANIYSPQEFLELISTSNSRE